MAINQLNKMEQIALFRYILVEESNYNVKNKNDYDSFLKKHNISAGKIFNYYMQNRIFDLNNGILSFILKDDRSKLNNIKMNNEENKKIYIEVLIQLSELFSNLIDFSTEEQKKYFRLCKIRTDKLLKKIKLKRMYTVSEICENISNPLNNDEFMKKVFNELLKTNKVNVRELKLSGYKSPKDGKVTAQFKISIYKELLNAIVKKLINTEYDNLNDNFKLILNFDYDDLLKFLRSLKDVDYERISEMMVNDNFEKLGLFYKSQYHIIIKRLCGILQFESSSNVNGSKTIFSNKDNQIRIYINISKSEYGFLFFKSYILKCFKKNIDYSTKYFFSEPSQIDRTILYLSVDELPKVVKILNEIADEHPEWIESFGTPLSNTGTLNDSYYGICYIGGEELCDNYIKATKERNISQKNVFSYNDCCDLLFKYAYASLITEIAIDNGMIGNIEDEKILRRFAELEDVEYKYKVEDNNDYSCLVMSYRGSAKDMRISGKSIYDIYEMIEKKYDLFNRIKMRYPNLLNNIHNFERFKIKCQHISDGLQERFNKKGNICVSKVMDDYCELEKQLLREQHDRMIGKKRKD